MQEGENKPVAENPQQYEAVPVSPSPSPEQQPAPNWQYSNDDQAASQNNFQQAAIQPIKWTASEFIAHSKNAGWYLAVAGIAIATAGVVYLLTKDKITTGMVIIVAILFAVMGARKPRELEYVVSDQGIQVGQKFYSYSSFKSFSIVQEGGVESIWFMPLERLKPGLSIYFAPNDGQKIVDALSQTLPVESRELDPLDRLMHKLRF